MAAHLVVYDSPTNPTMPPSATVNSHDQWQYALAMSDPIKWRECITPYTTGTGTVSL